jgi:hypothetical protein
MKTQGTWVVEIGWRILRIEVAGDICMKRPRPTRTVELMMIMIILQVRKAYWLEVWLHSFLTSALDRCQWSILCPDIAKQRGTSTQ